MDRNTLLAFFLIALVLLFTPKYMETFGPVVPTEEIDLKNDQNKQGTDTTNAFEKKQINKKNQPRSTKTTSLLAAQHRETLTTIETPLYTALLSSVNGGSIKEFRLKDFLSPDSQSVNTISKTNQNNLEIEIQDLNGDPLPLSANWELTQEPNRLISRSQKSIEYKNELFGGKFIKKTLTFYPESYTIDVDIDFKEIKDFIYRDVKLSWKGGLASTEKDSTDDKTYFKAAVYQGKELEELKVKKGEKETKKLTGATDWGAVRTKYFVSALIPKDPTNIRYAEIFGEAKNNEKYDLSFVFDCFQSSSFILYHGPLEYEKIKNLNVGLDEIMDFGWSFIRPVSKGVLFSLKKMHDYIPNYGVVLILFSVLVKILVFPLTKKSYQSTAAMQQIQPEVNALRDKHKNNPQKLNQATMQLYKEKGVNPLGGCLPMLLQMPLLFALFQVFRTTIELRNEPFVWWIKDLSSPDVIINLPFTVPLYGSHIAFLPILMVISTFIQQKMMSGGIQQPQQKMMQNFMMIFFFLIFNNFPSGLNLYYTLFNILTIAQQKLLPATSPR